MALPIVYNIRNVMNRPVATLTTALGIGLTVAILISALALAAGFRQALVSTGRNDNAIVLRKGADSELTSGIGRDQANTLRALPDVATGANGRPLVSTDLVVVFNKERAGGKGSSNVVVRGVDPEAIGVRGDVRVTQGRMFTPGTDEIIVGHRIAKRFENCAVGDEMKFQQRTFKVIGQFEAGGSAFESEVWGDVEVMMPAMGRDNVFQSVTFRMKDPAQFDRIRKSIEDDPRLGFQVKREKAFYASQSGGIVALITSIGVFITLIMGVGAIFGAANTMFAAVGSRTREIATLLVLGFSPLSIMVSFMLESILIALVGGVIGCILALPINGITTSTTNFASFSEVAFQLTVTPVTLVAGLVFAFGLGLVGGFFPALRAARQPLARALRGG